MVERIASFNKPLVFVDSSLEPLKHDAVVVDFRQIIKTAVYYLIEMGHKKIAYIGVNDIPTAKYVLPPLTTVRIYMDFIGETVFELLISRLKQGRNIPLEITVASKLKIRKSVSD